MKISYFNGSLTSVTIEKMTKGGIDITIARAGFIPGGEATVSERFWRSFRKVLKLDSWLFEYFSSDEIFNRVLEKKGGEVVLRFCIEQIDGSSTLLAVSDTTKPIRTAESLVREMTRSKMLDGGYTNGEVFCIVDPPHQIGGRWKTKKGIHPIYKISQPVDGHGKGFQLFGVKLPGGRLFFDKKGLRMNTSATDPSEDFFFGLKKTGLKLPDKIKNSLHRHVLAPLNFSSIADSLARRLEDAEESASSLREIASLYKIAVQDNIEPEKLNGLFDNPFELYGIASHQSLTDVRLSNLPSRSSVLDLLSAAAFLSGGMSQRGKDKVWSWAAQLLSEEFDFERTSFEAIVESVKNKGYDHSEKILAAKKGLMTISSGEEHIFPLKDKNKSDSDQAEGKSIGRARLKVVGSANN